MALDASFEKVENVRPHPNADKLDMCEIGGYPVVIGKNQFKNGDVVFYIREDAQLTGDIQRFPWQANVLKYASGSGRIKVIKLRGEFSSGLTVPVSEVYAHIKDEKSKNLEEDNKKIHSEEGVGFLLDKFGSDEKAMKQAGLIYASEQIIDLYANGIKNVHVYSMNKPEVAKTLMTNFSEIIKWQQP